MSEKQQNIPVHDADCLRSKRLLRGMAFITIAVACIYACNNILTSIDFHAMLWRFPQTVPIMKMVGNDFNKGIYEPGSLLWNGQGHDITCVYPPLTFAIGMPFALLPYPTAYLVQVLALFMLNIATLWVAMQILRAVCWRGIEVDKDVLRLALYALFALILFMDLTSYGFHFSIERGNIDIYAQFLSVLGLWYLVTKPDRMWLPVLTISLAVNVKLYPLVLFAIVFWRYRWKCLIPIAVTNVILLLMLGPVNLVQFIDKQCLLVQAPYFWIGNHSAVSFAQMVLIPLGVLSRWARWGGVGLPVIFWLIGTFLLWKRDYHARHAMLLFMLSVPLMCVLPCNSHDYKLVILYAPCLMLLAGLLLNYTQEGGWKYLLMIGVLLVAMGFMSRSFFLISPLWLQNKYPFILIIQAIVLTIILLPTRVFHHGGECRGTGANPTRASLGDQTLAPV